LKQLAQNIARRFPRSPLQAPALGWCSWYAGYESDISELEIKRNLEASLNEVLVVQIDDGWMKGNGTRVLETIEVDTDKFPAGMDGMALEIEKHERIPGLWIRPFQSWTSEDAPEWARGTFDLSNPEALTWLRKLASYISIWGYSYIKMDFMTHDFFGRWGMEMLSDSGIAFSPHDDTQTNIQMYRNGLQALRDGFENDRFILACNCLLGPAIGIVDGMRIGDDVSAWNWERTMLMGARSVAPMQYLNGSVWWNDPDCMLAHEPLSLKRSRLWNTFVAFTGGMRFISSKLYELDEPRRKLFEEIVNIHSKEAYPLDYPVNRLPSFWINHTVDQALLGVFNWSEESNKLRVPLERLQPYVIQSSERVLVKDEVLVMTLTEESCMILELRINDASPR
jgi:alpha-galactosidase